MDKQEFVTGLRRSLSGIDDYEYINDTVNYYENYIETEVRQGKTEEAVLRMLGDPGLIAKSIKASRGEITPSAGNDTEKYNDDEAGNRGFNLSWIEKLLRLPSWALKLGGAVIVVGLIVLLGFLIQWLFPVLVIGGIAYVFYKFVRDNFM